MRITFSANREYIQWLGDLKTRIHSAQIRAALQVNVELIRLYWDLGKQILLKQQTANWGDAFLVQLASDLMVAFPGQKGFSRTNLQYIRKWVAFYIGSEIAPQVVGQLQSIDNEQTTPPPGNLLCFIERVPWGHNREIVTKCATVDEALFYLEATRRHNWSRAVLIAQIESGLYQRKGAAITNFDATLSLPQADLAREVLKNPYNFEFLALDEEVRERDLETALVDRIQHFLLELGQGFAYMGRQFHLRVGESDFYLDLLFYHTRLRAFIVAELKTTAFQPEFAGKLNFYLNAIDAELKHPADQPSIGILLCRTPDKVVAEYSLKNLNSPLGVAEYRLTRDVPNELEASLPSIEKLASGLWQ